MPEELRITVARIDERTKNIERMIDSLVDDVKQNYVTKTEFALTNKEQNKKISWMFGGVSLVSGLVMSWLIGQLLNLI